MPRSDIKDFPRKKEVWCFRNLLLWNNDTWNLSNYPQISWSQTLGPTLDSSRFNGLDPRFFASFRGSSGLGPWLGEPNENQWPNGTSKGGTCKTLVAIGFHSRLLGRRHVTTFTVGKAGDQTIAIDASHGLTQIFRDFSNDLHMLSGQFFENPGNILKKYESEKEQCLTHLVSTSPCAPSTFFFQGSSTRTSSWWLGSLLPRVCYR